MAQEIESSCNSSFLLGLAQYKGKDCLFIGFRIILAIIFVLRLLSCNKPDIVVSLSPRKCIKTGRGTKKILMKILAISVNRAAMCSQSQLPICFLIKQL